MRQDSRVDRRERAVTAATMVLRDRPAWCASSLCCPRVHPPRCGARAARRRAGVAPPTCGHTTLMGTPQTSPAARPLRQGLRTLKTLWRAQTGDPHASARRRRKSSMSHLRAMTSCKRKAVTRLARPANLFCSNEVLISSGRKSSWESPIRHVIMNSL